MKDSDKNLQFKYFDDSAGDRIESNEAADPSRIATSAAEVLDLVVRLVYAEAQKSDLTPTQWSALRFFSERALADSTIGSFADFYRITHSSASQTISRLEKMGLVSIRKGEDSRVRLVSLTGHGRGLLQHDPIHTLGRRLDRLPDENLTGLSEALALLVSSWPKNSG